MAFTLTSKSAGLTGSTLRANCKARDSSFRLSTLDLNTVLTNVDGAFALLSSGFAASSRGIQLTEGSILQAELRKRDGSFQKGILDLNLCIRNLEGELTFLPPQPSLLVSTSCVKLEGTFLKAICLGLDGKLHQADIDLNLHYGNSNGKFASGSSGFRDSSKNVTLSVTPTGFVLRAELRAVDGSFVKAEVNIPICVVVREGSLVFVKRPDDTVIDGGGPFANSFDVVRTGQLVLDAIATLDNQSKQDRDVEYAASSLGILEGVKLIGSLGGILGAIVCAGIASRIDFLAETALKKKLASKSPLKDKFDEAVMGSYIFESIRRNLAADTAPYVATFILANEGSVAEQIASSLVSDTAFSEWEVTIQQVAALNDA